MTCNNNEECPMQERDNCTCKFLKNLLHKLPNIFIWSLPILLGLLYIIFYLYFYNAKWIKELSPNIGLIGSFFAGTLAYYGVLYTLTYRVKVEVLSKNRQEWINSLRNELSIYFSYFSELSLTMYDGPTIEEYQKIQKQINQTYNKIFFYLNKNEYISHSLLFIMKEMQKDSKRLGLLIEITENMKINNYCDLNRLSVIHLYNENFEISRCNKIIKFFNQNINKYKPHIQQLNSDLSQYSKETNQALQDVKNIKNILDKNPKYKINLPNNDLYENPSPLHQELQDLFQKLGTICLKEEWERVKKAR